MTDEAGSSETLAHYVYHPAHRQPYLRTQ